MVWYAILADIVVVIHALFVALVVFGFAAILIGLALGQSWARNFWFRTLHLAAIGIVAAQAILGVLCPLTTLENVLREQAGQATYPGSFIGYWAHRLIFYQAPMWVFTVIYVLFGVAVLVVFVAWPPRWPSRRNPSSSTTTEPPMTKDSGQKPEGREGASSESSDGPEAKADTR